MILILTVLLMLEGTKSERTPAKMHLCGISLVPIWGHH